MRSFRIRRLGPGDGVLFQQMNTVFGDAFDDPETYTTDRPDESYVADFLAQDHIHALVAIEGQEVIGGLVGYELRKFERVRSEIYIYDLAVQAQHRRRGVATALIKHLRELATERGIWIIYVQADYGDDPAIALYTKLGTREDVMHFDIPVQDAGRAK
ncbi:MAG: AAC(3)-I family aminoglycoside N-acetyltransferase [Rhizobiaceae bacterium]|nr:AAC(3)-I family aminoglycoside N-acetyltransferase [Rhizobiaceae bacterium]